MDNQNNRNKQNLPGNNNPNNKNNRQRWNIILFTVMLISFIVFALYQFREDTDAREITYDQFLNMVDSGEVKKVVIEDDKIMITAKTEAEMKNSKKKGASESDVVEGSVADNNDSSSKDSSDDSTGLFSNVTRKQYYTGIVKDDTLSDRLYKAGVEYEQKIPDSTSYMVMNLLVNIVPLVIMIGLGVMLMRRMTKGGGMMGVGKSNAKMYVEKSTGVTFKDVAGQDEAKESLQEVVDHNPLLDALLSKKYEEASRKGVMVYFDLPDLRDMPMGQTDLVIVLSNLLNNAIEAAAQADPPEVYVRMRKSEDEVVLSVRNRVKKDLNLVDGQLPRISQKGAGHGFGLWNVRDVLKKYGGEYTISCRECWFRFTCTIPLRKL